MPDRCGAAFYNENNPFAAQWSRNLVAANLVTGGDVDERSIEDLQPADVAGYERGHFFAGIGLWDLALDLAGWTGPVWTGSCPCQPFSVAGKRRGTDDPRHLWPAWFRIIRECRPVTIFGEQVASPAGRAWLDLVADDMEGAGYAVGSAVLGAYSVGAPHRRRRIFWVAHTTSKRRFVRCSGGENEGSIESERRRVAGTVGQPIGAGLEGHAGDGADRRESGRIGAEAGGPVAEAGANPWASAVPIHCQDGKARFVEPGVFPLAHGHPGRVGRLRAYGNAIVPQVAAAFIRAFMETPDE